MIFDDLDNLGKYELIPYLKEISEFLNGGGLEKMPTGDPLMPASVKRAKQIRYNMTDRADIGHGEDAEVIVSETMHSSIDDEFELDGGENGNELTAPSSSLEPDSTVAS